MTRVGAWYASGPEDRPFAEGDPDWQVHRVVADECNVPGCVVVENGAGQRFPVAARLVDQIAAFGKRP